MSNEYEKRGCEFNPELCEEEFGEDGINFDDEEEKYFE